MEDALIDGAKDVLPIATASMLPICWIAIKHAVIIFSKHVLWFEQNVNSIGNFQCYN